MRIELISTGNEVLHGEIPDTNSAWLSNRMTEEGYPISRVSTVGDHLGDLVQVFQERGQVSDIVLVNGGLGPTEDDLTSRAASDASGCELVLFDCWVERLKAKYQTRDMPLSNLKQARLPKGAIILDNPHGTACGFRLKIGKADFFFSPGVPIEMKPMFQNEILPRIKQEHPNDLTQGIQRLFLFGLSESKIGEMASPLETGTVKIGFRASFPLIEVKVQGPLSQIEEVSAKIGGIFKDFVFSRVSANAAGIIQDLLVKDGKTLAIAESCTGGLLSSLLVSNEGSSGFFLGSVVAYSNPIKMAVLGVKQKTLEEFGAVSDEVAREMALGTRVLSMADFAVAVTGIAGPDGGTPEKPVGTVSFCLSSHGGCFSQTLQFPLWGRDRIRHGASMVCLDMLRRYFLQLPMFPEYDYAKRRSSSGG